MNAGRPITLFVDDDVLMEVHGTGDMIAAGRSFESALRSRLVRWDWGTGPFDRIYGEAKAWRSSWPSSEASPALPLLAASALAVSRMARGEGFASTNYYVQFSGIVDLKNSQRLQNAYAETLPELWMDVSEWMDKVQHGRFGSSTITGHDWFTRYGYALSQSLFRQSDRDRLPVFFKSIGLIPHSVVDSAELLPYFKRWAVNAPLSAGAKRMITAKSYEGQLGAMLAQAASAWDGAERDEQGRRLGRIAVAVEFTGPRGSLVLIGERPRGFPAVAEFTMTTGEHLTLRSSGGGWYDESPLRLPVDALRTGIVMQHGTQFTLRLPPDPVVPLRQNEELGRWVATPRLALGVEHYLLVRHDKLDAVRETIRDSGGSDAGTSKAIVNIPDGYLLLRDVVVMHMPAGSPLPDLLPLSPAGSDRPMLAGGLRVDVGQGSYLRGGEPDVLIPPAAASIAAEYVVDVVRHQVPNGGGQIALSELDLAEGSHRFQLGPSTLPFFTIGTLGRLVPPNAGSIGFRFRRESEGYRALRAGAEPLDRRPDSGEIVVCGASVTGNRSLIPEALPAPIVVPRGRHRYFIIGRRIGDIDEIHQPSVPDWLRSIKLYPIGFEYYPRFAVAWLLMEETHFWAARQVQGGPPSEDPPASRPAVRQWCHAVLSGMGARVDGDASGWLEYVLSAEDSAW